jgi:hypothetical protein
VRNLKSGLPQWAAAALNDGGPPSPAPNLKPPLAAAPATSAPKQGLLVGVAAWQPDGKLGGPTQSQEVCDTTTVQVPASLGPFGDRECGSYDFAHLATLLPDGRRASPLALATPVTVNVTGCAADGSDAAPTVAAQPPAAALKESYAWTLALTRSSAASGLAVKRARPTKVSFVARTTRTGPVDSASLAGTVLLGAPGDASFAVQSATVSRGDGSSGGQGGKLRAEGGRPLGQCSLRLGPRLTNSSSHAHWTRPTAP